jgi:hypothetical protein
MGSALFDFIITLIVLGVAGAMFFVVIDKAAPDPSMNKVAKLGVGGVFAVILLLALKGLLFGGSVLALSAGGLIAFAIGIIVILLVLYLLDIAIGYLAGLIGQPLANIIRVVAFALILIALLVLVDKTLMGGHFTGPMPRMTDSLSTPSIMKPERR